MLFYTLSVFSVAVIGLCTAEELPVTICKRNSPNFNDCLLLAIRESWPRFLKGLPEFDFPPLDPLTYKFGKFEFDSNVIHGAFILNNITNHGLKKATFSAVRTHFLDDVFRLEIDTQVPWIFNEGYCKVEGTIGGLKLGGKGFFNVTIEDVKGTWDMIGKVTNDTWTVEHFYYRPTVKNLRIYLDDLFDGNKEFNNLALFFVNEYWPILYRAMLPIASERWDPWLIGFPNFIFSKIPFSKLFP